MPDPADSDQFRFDSVMTQPDTIFALSSGAGRAGIAVVRVSGPDAAAAFSLFQSGQPPARMARVADLRSRGGDLIDQALLLWFPAPHSATGENVAELHVHGSPVIVEQLLRELASVPAFSLAEPGEFTRRAFLNGRMDLLQVEGLADALAAETPGQLRLAMRQFLGEASGQYEAWRSSALRALALLEAAIDFSDEGDVGEGAAADAGAEIARLAASLREGLAMAGRAAAVRRGVRVVIAGPANAGKSSLLNWLVGREAAIVSAVAGTTRDVVEAPLLIAGQAVSISDTAGFRDSSGDAIEDEGMRRSTLAAQDADILVWVQAVGSPIVAPPRSPDLLVISKSDLYGEDSLKRGDGALRISVLACQGLDEFRSQLESLIRSRNELPEHAVVVQERHRAAVEQCLLWLDRAAQLDGARLELAADDMRRAAQALSGVTGKMGSEDVLGAIFGEFCIGK
ncbi:MAG: tRNA uridine-5-carboxymethylaminomethyl(34) synthesis GTPase MnmE [Hyphomicrobiales bacterium]